MNLHKLAKNGEFCCQNGLCIDSENRCDSSLDCVDHSDEKNCQVVTFPFQHNVEHPPAPITVKRFPTLEAKYFTKVYISMELFTLFDINEVTSEISMIFKISLKWRDPRLKFLYLKDDIEKNVIDKNIWIPEIVFGNLKEHISESKGKIKVMREGRPKLNTHQEVTMQEIYEGSENTITLHENYQIKFICSFQNIDDFPFDFEFCHIDIINIGAELVTMIPLDIEYFGRKSIAQYTVRDISLSNKTFVGGSTGLQVRIELGRDFRSIFCVTYLPTILMNIINQSTNYLDNSQFLEAIITVNITCMMVLAALYISVSTSLPATANIKYIDVWLLFSLIFPFLIILINILLFYAKKGHISAVQVQPCVKSSKSKIKEEIKEVSLELILQCVAFYVNPVIYILFVIFYLVYGMYGL